MTKFDHSTRLLARQALRRAVHEWPLLGEDVGPDLDADRTTPAWEERSSRESFEAELAQSAAPGASGSTDAPSRRSSSLARMLFGALAVAFGLGLAWAATARLRRA